MVFVQAAKKVKVKHDVILYARRFRGEKFTLAWFIPP